MTTIAERRAQDEDAVLFICDFSPPRSSSSDSLEPARHIAADFISVAYNPGRSVRVNSAFAAYSIKDNTGKDVLFTLATRDMNKLASQSLLLGAALLDLDNVMVLRGDDFIDRELEVVKEVHDFRPTDLLASIVWLNQGIDYKGLKLRSPTNFCVGASIDLGHDIQRETALTRRKVEAGAQFFLLQALFEPSILQGFLAEYSTRYRDEIAAPIFCGVQVMTQDSLTFGDIPQWVTDDLGKGRAGEDIAVQVINDFVDNGFRSIYLIPPVLRGGRRDYEAAQRVLESFRR